MIILRPARPTDAEPLARLHVCSWVAGYRGHVPPEMLAAVTFQSRLPLWQALVTAHRTDFPTLVAANVDPGHHGDEIVGFITASPTVAENSRLDGVDCELHMLFVAPAYQRRDVARRLFYALAAQLSSAGHRGMVGWVLAQPQADRCCRAFGGTPVTESTIPAFGHAVLQTLYLWPDLTRLPPLPG